MMPSVCDWRPLWDTSVSSAVCMSHGGALYRLADEPREAAGVDGADPRCGEGALPRAEDEARHAQIRAHLPRLAGRLDHPEEPRQGRCLPAARGADGRLKETWISCRLVQ